jgi:hypothetical protein
MFAVENKDYSPGLRWKKGEMDALLSLDAATKARLLPDLIFPPLSARDIELKRALSREEFIRVQIGRLQRNWPSLPCLVDFRFVQFDSDRGSDAGWLTQFLTTSQKFGCQIIPVFDARVDFYRMSTFAAYMKNSGSGGCIRIDLGDLQDSSLPETLNTLLSSARLSENECILLIDLAEAEIADVSAFARFTAEWLTRLRQFGKWRRIIVQASSYPIKNPAKQNSSIVIPRFEWMSWCHLAKHDPSILEWGSFGDFGADHGHINFGKGGRTITHLRYARPEDWMISRGGDPSTGHDGTIHTVASRIRTAAGFMGAGFSAGDEFVELCAGRNATGNASTWRFANMAHHLTLMTSSAARLMGTPFEPAERLPLMRQLSLLSESVE